MRKAMASSPDTTRQIRHVGREVGPSLFDHDGNGLVHDSADPVTPLTGCSGILNRDHQEDFIHLKATNVDRMPGLSMRQSSDQRI
jgi:hypothetical protein